TVRTFNPDLRKQMKHKMESIIKGITEAFGAQYEFKFHDGYPVLVNDAQMVERVRRVSDQIIGESNREMAKPGMGGEDFAFIAERVPSVMFRLGTCGGEQTSYPGHHPLFDVDEEALPYGAA